MDFLIDSIIYSMETLLCLTYSSCKLYRAEILLFYSMRSITQASTSWAVLDSFQFLRQNVTHTILKKIMCSLNTQIRAFE